MHCTSMQHRRKFITTRGDRVTTTHRRLHGDSVFRKVIEESEKAIAMKRMHLQPRQPTPLRDADRARSVPPDPRQRGIHGRVTAPLSPSREVLREGAATAGTTTGWKLFRESTGFPPPAHSPKHPTASLRHDLAAVVASHLYCCW